MREPPGTLGQTRERWGEVGAVPQVLCGPLKEQMRVLHHLHQRVGLCHHRMGQCGKGGREDEEVVVAERRW